MKQSVDVIKGAIAAQTSAKLSEDAVELLEVLVRRLNSSENRVLELEQVKKQLTEDLTNERILKNHWEKLYKNATKHERS